MDDLLTLDYSGAEDVVLTAVDLDPDSLSGAEANYRQRNPPVTIECEARDAWNLESADRWDLITSNGLNIYVEDDERCTDFYRSVSRALRPEGVFIVSFITPPDEWQPTSASDLDYQRFLFQEVLPVKWTCVRDEVKTRQQLTQAGFEVISVTHDEQRMFPAVVAKKAR
ncbi:class I SAM-dependent methyltransferase [Methylolobus aquaticus]